MIHTYDLRTLQAFVIVAREGNVTRAAERLHLTQPAVSLKLRRLAEAAGLVLFRRTPHGLELTRDGAALAARAEQVLAIHGDFCRTAQHLAAEARGKLRIGTIIDPEFIRLGPFLNLLVREAPGIETELRHGMSGDVPPRLMRDELDVGYYLGELEDCTPAAPQEAAAIFHEIRLSGLTYRVVAPPAWADLVKGRGWKDLAALPWIGTPPASVHNRMLGRLFERHGVRQNVVCRVDQEASMLAMARTGVGLSLCRDSIALQEQHMDRLVIADRARVATSLRLLCLHSRRDDPAVRFAFAAARRIWDSPAAITAPGDEAVAIP